MMLPLLIQIQIGPQDDDGLNGATHKLAYEYRGFRIQRIA